MKLNLWQIIFIIGALAAGFAIYWHRNRKRDAVTIPDFSGLLTDPGLDDDTETLVINDPLPGSVEVILPADNSEAEIRRYFEDARNKALDIVNRPTFYPNLTNQALKFLRLISSSRRAQLSAIIRSFTNYRQLIERSEQNSRPLSIQIIYSAKWIMENADNLPAPAPLAPPTRPMAPPVQGSGR